ncbi:MAG TPA: DUF4129 domain-containing protein [Puia sp.]|nr:DUF4129 domain-containing protein [Puia sp.]
MMVLRRAGILFLLSSLLVASRGVAQQSRDTVEKLDTTVADTVVVGGTVAPPGQESTLDTSTLVNAGSETGTGDQPAASLRTVPDSVIDAYKKDRHFAYANDPAYWRHEREEPGKFAEWLWRVLTSAGFRWCVLIALAGLLLWVIVRVVSENNLHVFYRRRVRKTSGDGETGESLVEEDLDERLQHYLALGDHRQAVRYLYLRTLRGLNERGLIRQTLQATNHEYLRQLNGTEQERPFGFLTTAYEKVWYGEFTLGETQFQRLYQDFVDFDKTVRS